MSAKRRNARRRESDKPSPPNPLSLCSRCAAGEGATSGQKQRTMSLGTNNVTLSYFDGDQTTYAVRDLTADFPECGFFGIMGPSGSGKSSLLYLLSGLKLPTAGDVLHEGRSLPRMRENERVRLRRECFGFVFQQPFLLNYLTARENILVAARKGERDAPRQVDALLDELNILHLGNRYPAHLSGGERQRLVVARAMINRPAIIFADEPTAALDHANGRAVIELLMRYRDRGAVLVVTHDPSMVAEADRVYHLRDGNLDHIEARPLSV
jgi:putative ABC transport system ATP-binding protein